LANSPFGVPKFGTLPSGLSFLRPLRTANAPPQPRPPLFASVRKRVKKRLVTAKSPINPSRRIRDVSPNTFVDQFYCATVNANLCSFVSTTDVTRSPVFVQTMSVGFERDFDGVFSPEQHGLEGQKALVACFVRLFVAMQSRMGFVVQPKFVVPTKLGCRSWLGRERAMTEIVVPTKLTDGLKGSGCRS
jgi:hypothetical protein